MLQGHSFRKAHISIGVGIFVMVVAVVAFGLPLTETESDITGASGFVAAFACFYCLCRREDRAFERAALLGERDARRTGKTPVR